MKALLNLLCFTFVLAPVTASAQELQVLSSRADTVSDGDALMAVALPSGTNSSDARIAVEGVDVTPSFKLKGRALVGLVTRLKLGRNKVTATVGGKSHSLVLTNHGRNGPIFSGPHQSPFICSTDRLKLPDGSTLGPPLDADCNAPTKVMFVYRPNSGGDFKSLPAGGQLPADMSTTTTLNGRTVNYIVRVETGTINRAIYQTSVLFDPTKDEAPGPSASYNGWNGRAVFVFGGGASAGYIQGAVLGDPLDHEKLSRGFAVLTSSLNVFGVAGSDVLSAETASMVKERFIETFGPPTYVIGWGGSGGSMQQHLIANNYPGILDGIIPGASFPDLYSLAPYPVDCALMARAFDAAKGKWTEEQKRAASGLNTWQTCAFWNRFFTPEWVNARQLPPKQNCASAVPRALTYDPVSNPHGARCDIYSAARNSLGFDRMTGRTYRGYDNVGVQYGLKAYRSGAISADQFVELNELIGGLDEDGDFRPARAVADPLALRRMFKFGRINEAENLDDLPIIDLRGNPGLGPDVHDAVKSETMRARIIRTNDSAAGHVMVRAEAPGATAPGSGVASHHQQMNVFALLKMDEWLSNMASDERRYRSKAAKVAANKPRELATDICFMADGTRIDEPSALGNSGRCGSKLPYFEDPRMTAGAPLTNDVLKCRLRPFRAADYPGMAPTLLARLKATFASGVCDYARPSVGHRRLKSTWLEYPWPGVARPIK
jgi:hypothetical protein